MVSHDGCNNLSFSFRKRIIAVGGETLLRNQQPDSTVLSEHSFKEKSSFSWDTCSVMSSRCSAPVDSKKVPQIKRSSVISLDYDTDHSDSVIDMKSSGNKDSRKTFVEEETICDSPLTSGFTKTSHNFSKNTNVDLDGSDLFSLPSGPDISTRNKSNTPVTTAVTVDIEPDDFYNDDFDIDDFNDSDIPDYFDEPQSSSVSGQNSNTMTTTVREGGPSKSLWEKKPTTPARTPKPANLSSPGQSALDQICLSTRCQ